MKKFLFLIALACTTSTFAQKNNYKKLGKQFVKSEMTRHPIAWTIDAVKPKWTYTVGLELLSMQGWMSNGKWVKYAKTYADSLIDESGQIKGYKRKDFKLDDINSGKMLFLLYDRTHDPRYKTVMETLYTQIKEQPRTPEGGMWHKTIYPNQMWLDGQYMSLPFYLEYAKRYCSKAEYDEAYQFCLNQIKLVTDHTLCPDCNLYHHACDFSKQMGWADKQTGRSAHVWGRAEGWMMMAMVDMLAIRYDNKVPEGTDDLLVKIVSELTDKILAIQDPRTHTWQQVLDCTGREGNYQEMTCTSMFAYTMLKGSRINSYQGGKHSNAEYKQLGKDVIDGIFANFVSKDDKGLLSLNNCCSVAGLSDKRDGSYEYYLSEKVIDNDPKGIGPLFMALKELK